MKNKIKLTIGIFLLTFSVFSQTYFQGSDIFRIGYGNSRTINPSTDVITVGLVSIDLTKTAGIFKEDAQAGVLVKATINGYDITSRTNQSTTIERLYIVDITKYTNGQISLPIEGTLFDNFKLSFDKNIYTKIELDLTILKKRKDTDFGFVIKNVAKLTQNLPFPTNPFDPIIKSFAGSISDMLSPSNDSENNIKERISTAKISLNFLQGSPFATKNGIFAVIFGAQPPITNGYIDIKKQQEYILSVLTEPKRAILVANKSTPTKTEELKNDNIMFFIEAFSSNVEKTQTVTTSIEKQDTAYSMTPSEIQSILLSSDWSSKTNSTFNNSFQSALKQYEKSNKFLPFIKKEDYEKDQFQINTNELLIIDYINAIEQRRQLGLAELPLTLPKPGANSLLKE